MNRLVRQFSWVTGGNIIAALLQLAVMVILMRSISPGLFGIVSSVLGIGIVLQAIFDLGLSKYIIRQHARGADYVNSVATALRVNSISSIFLIFTVGLLLLIFGLFVSEKLLYLIPISLSLGFEKNADTWIGVAIAEGKAKFASTNLVIRRTVSLISIVVLNSLGMDSVLSFSSSLAIAAIISVVYSRISVAKLIGRPTTGSSLRVLREASAYYANGLSVQLRNLDIFILSLLGTTTVAGLFSASKRITSPLVLVPTALSTVLLPAVSRSGADAQRKVPRAILVVSLLTLVPFLVIAWILPTGIPIFLGSAYANVILPMQLIVVMLPFAVSSSLLTTYLQGIGRAKLTALISLAGTVCYLSGIYLAALSAEYWYAIFALVLTPMIQSFLQIASVFVQRLHPNWMRDK